MRLTWICLLGVVACLNVAAVASEYRVLDQNEKRLIVELPNGLIVITESIPTAPVVSVQCWIKTGSIYEQQHNGAGLSHFLEHLVSGGTTDKRTEAESSAALGRMGAQTNAATSLDTVRYYVNTTSAHTAEAVDLVSDWMMNSKITPTEYARERDVIQREFEMGQGDPGRIFWKMTQQARYAAHPARHPTIGYLDEFLTVSRDEIYDFYKTMYVPNNMVFVVVGDIDQKKVVAQITELWKDAKPGKLPELSFAAEPMIDQPREVTGYADVTRPRLRLIWPGTQLAGEHDYALDLLAQILGQGELSRLVQTVRNEKKLVTSIDAYNLSFTWGEGFFGIDAQAVSEDQLDNVRAAVLEEIAKIKAEGVTEAELDRAKAKTIASVVYAAQTAEATASRLASDVMGMGNPDYLRDYAEAIRKLTPADLKAAAEALLLDDRITTLKLLPQREGVAKLDRSEDADASQWPSMAIDLDNRHLAAKITAHAKQTREAAAVAEVQPMQMHTLDNGLRVLIQRDTRLPIVAMQWYHLGGLLADDTGREGVANAMATMMMKGAGDRTAEQIASDLQSIGAQMSTSSGSNTFYLNALSLADDWQTVLGLAADVIQKPTFPADQWALMQPRLLAGIDAVGDRWSGEMSAEFEKLYFGDHPWSQPTVGRREVVESLTADDLKAFHGRRLSASDSVLAIVGDIDPAKVKAEVAKRFGKMLAKGKVPFERKIPKRTSTGVKQVKTAKPLTAVQIGFGPAVQRDDPDYAKVIVMTRIVSNFPSGWLHQALRGEGPGLVYASWAYPRTGVIPGYWTIAFNTGAATAPLAIERSMAVVDRLKNEPIDDASMKRAVSAALTGEAFGQQSNAQRATRAALNELYGIGFDQSEQYIAQLRAVTPADVQAAARKYLVDPVALVLSNESIDEATLLKALGLSAAPAE
jgi:zinc protease